jgi:hypothetical protein
MKEETQECFKCHVTKPLFDFYKHPEMANGHVGKCKECNKNDVQKNYKEKKPRYQKYYADREGTEKRKAWRIVHQRQYRMKNPVQYHCRGVTAHAMRSGVLVRKPCRVCGDPRSEAHHESYYEPLRVEWLCQRHHRELHKATR